VRSKETMQATGGVKQCELPFYITRRVERITKGPIEAKAGNGDEWVMLEVFEGVRRLRTLCLTFDLQKKNARPSLHAAARTLFVNTNLSTIATSTTAHPTGPSECAHR
jgi:hypothetical protein